MKKSHIKSHQTSLVRARALLRQSNSGNCRILKAWLTEIPSLSGMAWISGPNLKVKIVANYQLPMAKLTWPNEGIIWIKEWKSIVCLSMELSYSAGQSVSHESQWQRTDPYRVLRPEAPQWPPVNYHWTQWTVGDYQPRWPGQILAAYLGTEMKLTSMGTAVKVSWVNVFSRGDPNHCEKSGEDPKI